MRAGLWPAQAWFKKLEPSFIKHTHSEALKGDRAIVVKNNLA